MQLQHQLSLKAHNTLGISAIAEAYCVLHSIADAHAAIAAAQHNGWLLRVLGGGSNVVLGAHVSGLWLHQCSRGRDVVTETGEYVVLRFAAGENWHECVQWSLAQGACGLENLALIPGTVGAAPIQNIGAYGTELAEFVEAVEAVDLNSGKVRVFSAAECEFGYRDSVFKQALRDQFLIQSLTLRLPRVRPPRVDYPTLAAALQRAGVTEPDCEQVFDAVVQVRRERLPDPAIIPNVGSFFKNPLVSGQQAQSLVSQHPDMPVYPQPGGAVKLAAGWLIEQCGFKQQQDRAVRVHPGHALVIVNPESASGEQVQAFASEITAAVQQRFAVELEQEPRSYV